MLDWFPACDRAFVDVPPRNARRNRLSQWLDSCAVATCRGLSDRDRGIDGTPSAATERPSDCGSGSRASRGVTRGSPSCPSRFARADLSRRDRSRSPARSAARWRAAVGGPRLHPAETGFAVVEARTARSLILRHDSAALSTSAGPTRCQVSSCGTAAYSGAGPAVRQHCHDR
jgi:hypothetical protein